MAKAKSAAAHKQRQKEREMNEAWAEFEQELLEELNPGSWARHAASSIIAGYVAALRDAARRVIEERPNEVRAIRNIRSSMELDEIDGAFLLHAEAAEQLWSPLLIGFLDWMWATIRPDEVPLFLLRDAGPMAYLTQQPLWQHHRASRRIFLSRKLLGVHDEWTGQYISRVDESRLRKLLGRSGMGDHRVVLVDTGKYGSLVRRLAEPPYSWPHQSRFLVSGNPHIPGWLNNIEVPLALRTLILDSIEVFWVKKYKTIEELDPRTLSGRMTPRPLFVPTGRISQELYSANGFGMELAARRKPVGHRREVVDCESDAGFRGIARLLGEIEKAASLAAQGKWTGVLPGSLPASQDTATFFQGWPEALRGINPPHLLPSGYRANRRTVSLK